MPSGGVKGEVCDRKTARERCDRRPSCGAIHCEGAWVRFINACRLSRVRELSEFQL